MKMQTPNTLRGCTHAQARAHTHIHTNTHTRVHTYTYIHTHRLWKGMMSADGSCQARTPSQLRVSVFTWDIYNSVRLSLRLLTIVSALARLCIKCARLRLRLSLRLLTIVTILLLHSCAPSLSPHTRIRRWRPGQYTWQR